ncbi:MAG: hypothetical protein SQA66_11460 [Candidatus Fervidibacter sacchari]
MRRFEIADEILSMLPTAYNLPPDHSMFGVKEHLLLPQLARNCRIPFALITTFQRPFTDEIEMLRLLSGTFATENAKP